MNYSFNKKHQWPTEKIYNYLCQKYVKGKKRFKGWSLYITPEDAEKRNEYLAAFDGGIFASGSHAVIGTVLVRTSDKLKASEQKELEANIINVLTTIK